MDREAVLQAVLQENWEPVITWLYKNRADIQRDALLKYAADIFTAEFFGKLPTYALERPDITTHLATLLALHRGRLYSFELPYYKLLIVQIASRNQHDRDMAYQFASEFPEEEACRSIIAEYERLRPRQMAHSQSHTIRVTQQPDAVQVPTQDYRINLFKSHQEKQFFQALKNTFPSHHAYPNVAISCLLDWNTLRGELTAAEKDLFFKGIVDFVVFDQAQDFFPLYFFELDSPWHDTEKAQRNDPLKDSIFAKAGIPLFRIRKADQQVSENEFTMLIREMIQHM
jgi:Protein of unknown function (DUF2726)